MLPPSAGKVNRFWLPVCDRRDYCRVRIYYLHGRRGEVTGLRKYVRKLCLITTARYETIRPLSDLGHTIDHHPNGNGDSVSSTLLGQLRQHDAAAWERLCHLYGPVVYGWCRRAGIEEHSAADVMQDVFQSVASAIENFRRDRAGDSFSAWLATIARNKIHDHFRQLAKTPDAKGGTDFHAAMQRVPDAVDDERTTITPSDRIGVLHRALELIGNEFEQRTWQAFWRTAVEEQLPADVAADLGVSVQAVYKAKSRVLRRLRDELSGLMDN